GNGTYTVSDFDPLPFTIQGASLIVIFDDGITTNNRDITLYNGCDQNSNDSFDAPGWNISIPNVNYQTGDAVSLEFHVSDGQLIYNESPLLVNQNVLAPFGAIFSGSAPFDLLSGFRSVFFTGSLWDIREFNIGGAPFLVPGNNNLLITTGYQDDDLTVILTVLKSRSGSSSNPPPNNHAPVLNCPGSFTFDCVPKAGVTNTSTVIVQDADGDPLTVTWSINGVQVRQDTVPAGSPVTSAVLTYSRVYTLGNYNISVTVSDGKGGIQNCQSSVTITSVDSLAPVVDCGPNINAIAGTNGLVSVPSIMSQVRALDSCTPSNLLVYAQSPLAGTLVPVGTNTIFISVTDLSGNVGTCSLSFIVTMVAPPPPPPVNSDVHAFDDFASTTVNTSVTTSNVLLNDVDDNSHTLSVKNFDGYSVKGGTVVYLGIGKFVYTPALNYYGNDSFKYVVTDVFGNTSTATVYITISTPPINHPPVANPDTATTTVAVPVTVNSVANDTDPDGNAIYIYTFGQPANGVVTLTSTGSLTYTPSATFTGTNVFSYVLTDGKLYSTSTVTVVVTGVVNTGGKFTTYTQGGWGAAPSGSNPGTVLWQNFSKVYPSGLVMGSKYTLTFTTASAITDFLPQGGKASALSKSQTNPTASISVFAGQVLSMKLSVDFSAKGITRSGMGALKLTSGKLKGWKLSDVLNTCVLVLGGQPALPSGVTITDLNDIATLVNQNYDNGTVDTGYLTAN
ncbi:MAG: Ig family protein, partial [Verrucomicrobiales bacterium]|nr:Ig family protein [Verrucomicrobiales bacterium]